MRLPQWIIIQSSSAYSDFTTVKLNPIFDEHFFSSVQCKRLVHKKLDGKRWWKKPDAENLQASAVLVPLCTVNGIPSVILTRRSPKLYQNRGQTSFPGGKASAQDGTLTQTALRETWEEIGLVPRNVQIWAEMAPAPFPMFSRNANKKVAPQLTLTPFVGFCGEVDLNALQINPDEVDMVFHRTLASLCDSSQNGYTEWRISKTKPDTLRLPVFPGEPHRIWGATAVILHFVLKALAPECYTVSLKTSSPLTRFLDR